MENDACSAAGRIRCRAVLRLMLAAGLMAPGVCGCGPGHPKTYPVRGKVVFDDGAPLDGGFIEFESTPADGLPFNARGLVGHDGTFVLSTFAEEDGAVLGKHRVLVRAQRQEYDDMEGKWDLIPEPVIDPRFGRYETSGLEFTVTEGKNEFAVVVQRPPPAQDRR